MIDLKPTIKRINDLLAEDTEASVTYAALEARFGLERVCYDRLRQCHDYISHAQLQKWQPGAVVNFLMHEVDDKVANTMTLSIGKHPVVDGRAIEDNEFVEIGTQLGFDPKAIAKLWNALAKLALHVRLPESRSDQIPEFGDKERIRAKVHEVLSELERLSQATMTFSGVGMEVSFKCSCGEKNKRRAALLKERQHIYCINPHCKISFKVSKDQDEFAFEEAVIPVNCESCKTENHFPRRIVLEMTREEFGSFSCHSCGHANYMQWRLMQVRPDPPLT